MGNLAYPYTLRDSANSSTDNRKAGQTPTISNGKTFAASPATVLATTVTFAELGTGAYEFLYDAEANGDAAFPIDWGAGSGLTNPNDRYDNLVLTRDSGRVLAGFDATGHAGVDWSRVSNQSGSVTLDQTMLAVVGSVTGGVSGPVGSVMAAVTVGTNNDKVGYALSAAGLDVAKGWGVFSARQTLQAIAQFLFGLRSGVPSPGSAGTVTYTGPSSAPYGTVAVDNAGDVTANGLTPPA
jgi:hypothetical protein